MRCFKKILPLFMALTLITTNAARSDETSEHHDGVLVENAMMVISADGNAAELRLSVSNIGTDDVTLVNLATEIAEKIEIYYLSPSGQKTVVTDFTILQEETLELPSSHLHIDIVGLKRPLEPGAKEEFKLIFRDFEATAVADVHNYHE